MKKFIFMLVAMFATMFSVSAQESTVNYAGSSKFTDNWSVTLQGGMLTTFSEFYSGHTACAPIVVVGADKYITPWLGVGVDARTLIGTGHGKFNTHTAFDAVNLSGLLKVNVMNAIKYDGTRKFFEPVVYTGLGWGHGTASDASDIHPNYMTWRSGVEFNFNLGKTRAWAVVVNPSVVFGNPSTTAWATKLDKRNGNFELTAGVVYHFKNSNGRHSMSKAKLYDQAEVNRLTARIAELEARKPEVQVVEKVVEKTVTNAVVSVDTYVVPFSFDSAELTEKGKEVLNSIAANTRVNIDTYASVEPKSNADYNVKLTQRRADAVKAYLESRNVQVVESTGHGMNDEFGRVAIVTFAK